MKKLKIEREQDLAMMGMFKRIVASKNNGSGLQ
jgi:hypothetical protein